MDQLRHTYQMPSPNTTLAHILHPSQLTNFTPMNSLNLFAINRFLAQRWELFDPILQTIRAGRVFYSHTDAQWLTGFFFAD